MDAELGRAVDIKKTGGFGLLHDLTSVVRTLDVTEVDVHGARILQEVKARDTVSASTRAHKQIRAAQRLLDAVGGGVPLPGEDGVMLSRARTQMRTHTRASASLLNRIEQEGYGSARVADRIVGGIYLPALLNLKQPYEQLWQTYTSRRNRLLDRHAGLDAGLHRLKVSSGDTAGRDPAVVPWGLYLWAVRQRAALICDFLLLEVFMSLDQVAERFRSRGFRAEVQLRPDGGVFDGAADVLVVRSQGVMTVHGTALQQIMIEFIDTGCFVEASVEALQDADPGRQRSVTVYSNERACWR